MAILYDNHFTSGSHKPLACYNDTQIYYPLVQSGATAVTTGGAEYWPDDNHLSPGAGYLHLLAVLYAQGQTDALNRAGVVPKADLRGGKVTIRCKTIGNGHPGFYLPKTARLGWWVQTYDPAAGNGKGAWVNYFQVRNLVCEQMGATRPTARGNEDTWLVAGQYVDCVVPLTNDQGDWICLGARADKTQYGCSSIGAALKYWNVDMGLVCLMDEPLPGPPDYPYGLGYGGGQIAIDRITIETA